MIYKYEIDKQGLLAVLMGDTYTRALSTDQDGKVIIIYDAGSENKISTVVYIVGIFLLVIILSVISICFILRQIRRQQTITS